VEAQGEASRGDALKSGPTRILRSLLVAVAMAIPLRARAEDGNAAVPSTPASAPSAADVKQADALYRKARQLKRAGKQEEACSLFEESHRLDPVGPTLVNLAECHEASGRTGTAWRELLAALKLAKKVEDQELIGAIKSKLAAIVPRLYQVTVQVPRGVAAIPGVEIRFEDEVLSPRVPEHPHVVDPGSYAIHASAPGYVDFHRVVIVAGERRESTVSIRLDKVPAPPPDRRPAEACVGIGFGVLVIGGVLVGLAELASPTDPVPLQAAGSVMGGAGLVTGIVGLHLLFRDPPAASSVTRLGPAWNDVALRPVVVPGFVGIAATGVF
jgi:hypothetical protein